MTIISKTAGVISLVSCIHDVHKTALISSNNAYAEASSNAVVSDSVGYQKANRLSYRDSQRKNWLNQNNFLAPYKEFFARVGGYISGFAKASVKYIPNIILAGIAIGTGKHCKFVKNASDVAKATSNANKVANIAAIGLGIVEAIDFIKNATNIHQRKDYLN